MDGIALLCGYDLVMAYDVYNGRKYWERWIPGATRTDLPTGTSNLAADAQCFYVVINDEECLQLDRLTGKTLNRFRPPEHAEHVHWGWIAREGNLLLGSKSRHDERRRQASHQIADGLFAIDINARKTAWEYLGGGIEQDGIAVADGRVFFVDRKLTETEKLLALKNTVNDNKDDVRNLERGVDRRGTPIEPDLGKLVAVNQRDGSIAWQQPFNFSDNGRASCVW